MFDPPWEEDERRRHVQGKGRFTSDLALHDMAHGIVVRSEHAHGVIKRIGVEQACRRAGVLAIITGEDLLAAGFGPIPTTRNVQGQDGKPHWTPPRHGLAIGRVRHVGEPVCLVVAATKAQAADAAEMVEVEIEALPHVTDVAQASLADAPLVWPQAHGNLVLDWAHGDLLASNRAFEDADHIAKVAFVNNRVYPAPMEPRAAIADYGHGRYTLIAGTQGVGSVRRVLAKHILHVPIESVRVITPDVGGGFGMKTPVYPEYVALLAAARKLGGPVAWSGTRLEGFLGDNHGRDSMIEAEIALDANGLILGLRARIKANLGAYITHVGSYIPTHQVLRSLGSVYRLPVLRLDVRCFFTNTPPVGPYRGAGRPEANMIVERLLDQAARETGRDRVALRRANLLGEDVFPYQAPSGVTYDSGAFAQAMDKALAKNGWQRFSARRAEARTRNRLRGLGLACYLEATGGEPLEAARFAFDALGRLTIAPGTQAAGQDHAGTLARLFADHLALPLECVRIIEGDSDLQAGGGTVGSRSMTAMAPVAVEICEVIRREAHLLAALTLEVAAADLMRDGSLWSVRGTDRSVSLGDLARLHPGRLAGAVEARHQPTFPNGCHVCEVEIDPETGLFELVSYVAVDDAGRILNEAALAGQIHGGVAQALGQVQGEVVRYDASGQLATGSFLDYRMPRAADLPRIELVHHTVLAATNPLGVKGAGEGGTTGGLPALISAIADALADAGVAMVELPATPERLWRALRSCT